MMSGFHAALPKADIIYSFSPTPFICGEGVGEKLEISGPRPHDSATRRPAFGSLACAVRRAGALL
jgi:hypothetical protein